MDPGRRAHYADFYDGPSGSDRLGLVWGNCQAESLRVLLDAAPGRPLRFVRTPPVHELTADDMAPLRRLLDRTSVLLSQPGREGYRGLPVGTEQLASAMGARTRVLRWPVIRYTGLHPWSAIVRHPRDMSAAPPVVPYHDLRTLAAVAGLGQPRPPSVTELRAAAADSSAELAQRERTGTDLAVSDLLAGLGADAMHTVNHPGNLVLVELARRAQAALGWPVEAQDPGRVLLGGVRAPLERSVVEALALAATPVEHWTVDGTAVTPEQVAAAHRHWYETHPEWVAAGLRRHATRLSGLGFAPK